MHAHAKAPFRTVVPTLRYRNVAAAIDWLCNAFGFEKHLVVPGGDGAIQYAELTFGDGMIMLGPVENSAFKALMAQPEDMGGAETQICYLFVEDLAAHGARSTAAGAVIVLGIEEMGGRGYSCRDPEGHIWNFGTYNPWRRASRQDAEDAPSKRRGRTSGGKRARLIVGLLAAVVVATALCQWVPGAEGWPQRMLEALPAESEPPDAAAQAAREQLARAREGRDVAERAVKDFREQLARERAAREAAERSGSMAAEQLAQERKAKEAAERAARETREQLVKAGLEKAAKDMSEMRERTAAEAAQRVAEEARQQLMAERAAREASLRPDTAAQEEQMRAAQEQQEKERAAQAEAERAAQEREQAAKERAKEERAKEAAREVAREARREREAAKRPAPRPRASSKSQSSKPPPVINWGLGG